jgi:hypothetical protein
VEGASDRGVVDNLGPAVGAREGEAEVSVVIRPGDRVRIQTDLLRLITKAIGSGRDHLLVDAVQRVGDDPVTGAPGEIFLKLKMSDYVPETPTDRAG